MHSSELFERAKKIIPGGVNSPVRAFGGVGGDPIFFDHGKGSHLYSVEGKQYIDYVSSWGPLILGHAHPAVLAALEQTMKKGTSFGAPTALEVQLAEKITQIMPSIEMVRMVNSGTEATLSAVRLARGFTGRNKIIKFIGCYHGHCDPLLIKAGSGALTFGVPSSAGISPAVTQDTLTAHFNDLDHVKALFKEFGDQIAAIIVEPIAGNMNLVLPEPQFLAGLREICTAHQALLIFDEVITGFRVAFGGAQSLYNIKPDLTTLGKIIGGGLPVAAFGGRRDIMQHLSPLGKVYQAGTLSGNPLAMSAGLATLDILSQPNIYQQLANNTQQLLAGISELAQKHRIDFQHAQAGSMFGLYFTKAKSIRNCDDVMQGNEAFYKQFFHAMLAEGIYFAPSAFEVGFVSAAHTTEDIAKTLNAFDRVFQQLSKTQ